MSDVTAGYRPTESVIESVSLNVHDREFFAIIGPNGGGKTTLVRVILGLLEPMKGRCLIYGKPVAQCRHLLGYVPQFRTSRPDFPITVHRMVELGLENTPLRQRPASERRDFAEQAIVHVGLKDARKRRLRELSGGQFQRALIAQALVRRPRLLLLDEPTSSIDHEAEGALMDLFESLTEELTPVLISHDVHYVVRSVSRVACVNRSVVVHKAARLQQLETHEVFGYSAVAIDHSAHKESGESKRDQGSTPG